MSLIYINTTTFAEVSAQPDKVVQNTLSALLRTRASRENDANIIINTELPALDAKIQAVRDLGVVEE